MEIQILICMGTSGLSAGAEEVEKLFREELKRHNLSDKCKIVKTGDRGLFRDVLVDIITGELGRITYEYVKGENVAEIVEKHLVKGEPVEKLQAGEDYEQFFAGQTRIVLENCGEIDPEDIEDYIAHGGYEALKKAFEMPPEKVVEEVKNSGLRGRGGGGFPAGRKWEFCRNAKGDKKYVVCNADEGDPGAFMDRSVLEGDPNAVIEGMIIAGYATGGSEGYIYCRAEYPLAIKRLRISISQAREKGFLGEKVLGSDFSFDISIKEGAGAFVCGEETALIASIEGLRGRPVTRPPFPAVEGLWGKPTLINNVETLAGPSGGCLPESLLDTPIDYESITKTGAIMGSGGMVVMDKQTCMVDIAKFFINFTVAESCGKCVPCRIGLKRMLEVLEEITEGKGEEKHIAFLQEMGTTIKETALCGLGNTAPNPVLTTLKYFPDEYREHIKDKNCSSHVCTALLEFEVDEDKCTKCGRCFKACPVGAVEWKKKEYAKIDKDKCIKCKSCINACDFMAIK